MREVKPYHRRQDLIRLLDNGGRFWHLLCKTGDKRITGGELATASGWPISNVAPFIYLAMKMIEMPDEDQQAVLACLTPKLRARHDECRPHVLKPSHVETQGSGRPTIISTGYLRDARGTFAVIGSVTWTRPSPRTRSDWEYVSVPVESVYRTFTLHDSPKLCMPSAAMAFRGKANLPLNRRVRLGGLLNDLHNSIDNVRTHRFLFRPLYYTVLDESQPW